MAELTDDYFVSVVGVQAEYFTSVVGVEDDPFVSVVGVLEKSAIPFDNSVTVAYHENCDKATVQWGEELDIDDSCRRATAIVLLNMRTGEAITPDTYGQYDRAWTFSIDKDAPVHVTIYEDNREIVQNPDGTCTFTGEEINLEIKVSQPILVLCRALLCRDKALKLDLDNIDCKNCNYSSNFAIIDAEIISALHSVNIDIKDTITKIQFLEKFCNDCGFKCCSEC